MNTYKKILFLCGLLSLSNAYSFLPIFLQKMTWTRFFHGIVNNGILGGIYYGLCKFGEAIKKDSSNFAAQATLWTEAPEYLKKYSPHRFHAGTTPLPGASSLITSIIPFLSPNKDIYLIDDKILLSHRLIFDLQSEKVNKEALLSAIRFEYERKDMLLDPSEYAPNSFLQGIMKYIVCKQSAKYAIRCVPPFIRQKCNIQEEVGKIPYVAATSILDFLCKYYAGMWNFISTQIGRYEQSQYETKHTWEEESKTKPDTLLLLKGYRKYIEYQQKKRMQR